jgi:hypothetical protein
VQAVDEKHAENATAPPFIHTLMNISAFKATKAAFVDITRTLLFASAANAHVTKPLTVLFTKPEYLHKT